MFWRRRARKDEANMAELSIRRKGGGLKKKCKELINSFHVKKVEKNREEKGK